MNNMNDKRTTLLVPVDGSEASEQALSYAVKNTRKGDTIHLYHARQAIARPLAEGAWVTMPNQKSYEYAQKLNERYQKYCKESGRDCTFTVGDTGMSNRELAKDICALSKDIKADNVTMGMRTSRLGHMLMGSVSLGVATFCECPVTIVKHFEES